MTKSEIANKLTDWVRDSAMTQSILTLTLVGVAADLWIRGLPLTEDLRLLLFTAVGFFFGGKYQQAISRGAK